MGTADRICRTFRTLGTILRGAMVTLLALASLVSPSSVASAQENPLEVSEDSFFMAGFHSLTAKPNRARTSLSIRWSIEQEYPDEGIKVTIKGAVTAKRRTTEPADLAGYWSGTVSGKIKGTVDFTLGTEGPFLDGDRLSGPGFYSISGTLPPPYDTLSLFGHFLLNSKNQLVWGELFATDEEETSLDAHGIKGRYDPKSGKLTIQGKLEQLECDEEGFKCRTKRLPFKIIATQSP